eukprot:TRINITY_DN23354_c0_g1_i1.p1 TRINITY_DN23354_c0_g1~~TRINITY_DN23354_c0_g1_i1.p1  ORF type:complete len:144 (-),score=15.07 TRINITY_DN23354_c0_g1_i1:45-476(-)
MIRRPPRSTQGVSSAASDVYKRQEELCKKINQQCFGISESGIGYDLDWTTIELTQKGFQTIFTINGEGLDLVRLHIDNITVNFCGGVLHNFASFTKNFTKFFHQNAFFAGTYQHYFSFFLFIQFLSLLRSKRRRHVYVNNSSG